jgi:hypothetical protein
VTMLDVLSAPALRGPRHSNALRQESNRAESTALRRAARQTFCVAVRSPAAQLLCAFYSDWLPDLATVPAVGKLLVDVEAR